MKRILIVLGLLFAGFQVEAQIIDAREVTRQKAQDRTNSKADQTIEKGLDKLEEGLSSVFKKKDKKAKQAKKAPDAKSGYDAPKTSTDANGNTDYSAYKDFGFTPAPNLLFFDDFSDGSIKRWGAYDQADLALSQVDGQPWLEVKGGSFYPLDLKTLPNNFTLEFDVYTPTDAAGTLDVRFLDHSQAGALSDPYLDNSSLVHISPVSQWPKTGLGGYAIKRNNEQVSPENEFRFFSWLPQAGLYKARISMKRSGRQLSVWINKEAVMENTDFFISNNPYVLSFLLQNYFVQETRMYFTNFRLATGSENPGSLSQGKPFVTHNIFFDVNSDVIRPNSYAVLKQVAQSLAGLKKPVQIIGHTDSDGSDSNNLMLSEKRAASVKRALVNEFGLPENMLSSSGKGESQPLNKNASPAQKAQNRRVEFRLQDQ